MEWNPAKVKYDYRQLKNLADTEMVSVQSVPGSQRHEPAALFRVRLPEDSPYAREGCHEVVMESFFRLCNRLNRIVSILMQCWEMLYEERAEKVLGSRISRSQERSGRAADGRIRTPCNILAEVGANQPMRSNIEALPEISLDLNGV